MTSVTLLPESREAFSCHEERTVDERSSIKTDHYDSDCSGDEDSGNWRTNLFTLYARVFRIMLAKWKETLEHAQEAEKLRDLDDLILPSNEEWRHQVYYRLVDLQREIDLGVTSENAE